MKDNMTWKLKGCPRCSGDILIGEDGEGWKLESCLQCGYRKPLEPLREVEPIEIPDNLPPLPGIPNGGAMSGLARGNIIRPYLEKNSDLKHNRISNIKEIKMYQVIPKSEQAQDWIDENVQSEPWQWLGNTLVVDHHFIADLEQGMLEAGFTTDDVIVRHC